MNKPDPILFALQEMVSDLSLIDRRHYLIGSDRAEDDIEHSFSVALLCWYLQEKLTLKLDLSKVLKYAMVHDFAERYAGDVSTFASPADRQKKVVQEAASVKRLAQEFKGFPDMVQTIQNYDAKADEESLFVWTVDKMQSLILADLDNWRPHKKIKITYEAFAKKYREQLTICSPHCKEIFEELVEYCKTTYYDQPAVTTK